MSGFWCYRHDKPRPCVGCRERRLSFLVLGAMVVACITGAAVISLWGSK